MIESDFVNKMDDLAVEIDALPDLGASALLADPRLWTQLFFGPVYA